MIYVDTSVLLAQLLSEDRVPPPALWRQPLASSRLLEYEAWTRVHALTSTDTHGELLRALLGRVSFVEMTPLVLARAVEPFPVSVRTLDALHLATATYLRDHGIPVEVASYDGRLVEAARALGLPLATL